MYKLTTVILLVFAAFLSAAQAGLEISSKFDLDKFKQSIRSESDSSWTYYDSVPTISYRSIESCSNEEQRENLFELIENLRTLDQTNTIDTAQMYTLLFEVEFFSSVYQQDFDSQWNQISYCIHSDSKQVQGKHLVFSNLRDESGFHDCFQFTYTFSDSFLIIRKNCVRYGNMTNFHTDFVRFYELESSE